MSEIERHTFKQNLKLSGPTRHGIFISDKLRNKKKDVDVVACMTESPARITALLTITIKMGIMTPDFCRHTKNYPSNYDRNRSALGINHIVYYHV